MPAEAGIQKCHWKPWGKLDSRFGGNDDRRGSQRQTLDKAFGPLI